MHIQRIITSANTSIPSGKPPTPLTCLNVNDPLKFPENLGASCFAVVTIN